MASRISRNLESGYVSESVTDQYRVKCSSLHDRRRAAEARTRVPCRIPEVKKGWEPTPAAFSRFLTWLDEGVDSGGETYLEMRRRLVSYFDRKRCVSPDELADETLSRVVRRLDEEGTITESPT